MSTEGVDSLRVEIPLRDTSPLLGSWSRGPHKEFPYRLVGVNPRRHPVDQRDGAGFILVKRRLIAVVRFESPEAFEYARGNFVLELTPTAIAEQL